MSEPNPFEFTDREKFLIHYYKARPSDATKRRLTQEFLIMIPTVACAILAVLREEPAFWAVAYVFAVIRVYYYASESSKWGPDLQSIFTKYESRLAQRTASPPDEKPGASGN
jgi:hypothetical protein